MANGDDDSTPIHVSAVTVIFTNRVSVIRGSGRLVSSASTYLANEEAFSNSTRSDVALGEGVEAIKGHSTCAMSSNPIMHQPTDPFSKELWVAVQTHVRAAEALESSSRSGPNG
jgi:hypothetical protein